MSSCKKQTLEKTIVQQDTIIQHDTVKYLNFCITFQQIGDGLPQINIPNEYMIIEKGYGRLTITVFRK